MKHKRFEENILIDEAYTNYGKVDKNADNKKSLGIAKNFAESLQYDERKKWFHQLPQEPSTINTLNTEKLEELKKEANSALHGDTLAYETKANRSGSSDHQWAKTLLNKGAIGDRVAAATILIQDNPVYNLAAIRNLINNVKPAKKRDGIVIIDALSELIISDLLIPDVKLRTFEQHPLALIDEISSGNKQARRNILKLWYFEDQLKQLYEVYVESLNKFAHDSVDSNKEKAVSSMSYLLMHHPEREKVLLCNIINKLGDPSQAVASKVIYHLCQILYNHPNMKQVVLAEIEKMLFRTNISPRAQYYGVCFLNQFYLGKDDSKIAENLIRIYFSFFKASIKKGDIDSRLMSAILTGVKRAFPFADRDRISDAPEHINAIHKLVHLATFNVAIHALALLFQISSASKHTSDRYYTALYRKLTNAEIFNTTHSALLFSLVYKSLRQDDDVNRVASFIKRLLHLSCFMNPAQICAMLLLISQVLKDSRKKDAVLLTWTSKEVKEEKKVPVEEIKDDVQSDKEDDNKSEDEIETNSSKVENPEIEEEKVEEKRVDLLHGNKQDLLNDDDEETYVDLKIDDQGNIKPKKRKKATSVAGWHHANVKLETEPAEDAQQICEDKETNAKIAMKKTINMDRVLSNYEPFARNPSFSGTHCTAYLELLLLKDHFHPTVNLFAERLINNQVIKYSGDPLIDFSAIRFLDRFVFKNPKKRSELEQGDDEVKKVRGSHPKFALRKNYSAKGLKSISVTSASYLNEDVSRIPVDEKFLYDFLQKRRSENDEDDDSDKDSVTSDDFDKYLDSVTGANNQEQLEAELDYLADMEATKQHEGTSKKSKRDGDDDHFGSDDDVSEDDEEGDNDVMDDEDGSDGGLNISGEEDEPQLSGDEDELLLEKSDDEDLIDVPGAKKKNNLGLKLKGQEDLGSLFASAEEFSTLLEDTATNKKQGSIHAIANTDNSSTKQMAWEEKRDRWIKGFNKKVLGHKKPKGNFKNKKEGFRNKKEGFKNKKESFKNNQGGKRKGNNIKGGGGKRKKFN